MAIVKNSGNYFLIVGKNDYYTEKPLGILSTFSRIKQNEPSGANACINLRIQHGFYISCEYVKLVPKK